MTMEGKEKAHKGKEKAHKGQVDKEDNDNGDGRDRPTLVRPTWVRKPGPTRMPWSVGKGISSCRWTTILRPRSSVESRYWSASMFSVSCSPVPYSIKLGVTGWLNW